MMEMTSPNMTAIIVMAVIYMAIGWLWYSPKLFGSMMSCPTTKEEGKSCCWTKYVGEFVLACIIGYVLSEFAIAMHSDSIMSGIKLGFWAWLGFVATTMFSKVLWSHKPMKTFCIASGFYLLMFVIMGGALSVWH